MLKWGSQPREVRSDNGRVICLLPMLENSLSTLDWMSHRKCAPRKIGPALLLQSHAQSVAIETACRNLRPQIPKGRLFWTASLTLRILPEKAWCSVCEGLSPNTFRYSTEKRPNSTKPKQVAISVTVTRLESADRRARLAWDSRNIRRCRHGGRP